MSSKIRKEMNVLLKNETVDRHSFFQLKYFVIGKEPTIQSKMWRCLRELKSRKEQLDALEMEIDDANDRNLLVDQEIEILNLYGKAEHTAFGVESTEAVKGQHKRETEIEIRRKKREKHKLENDIAELQKKSKYTEEEAEFFIKAYESLSKKEKLKPFDDFESQQEYWDEKLSQEINLKLLLQQPLDLEVVKTALSLGDGSSIKQEILNILDESQKSIAGRKVILETKLENG